MAPTFAIRRPAILSFVGTADIERWFREYLNAFAACGRGDSEPGSLIAYYGVPLLLSTDDGFVALTTAHEVVAMAQRQVDAMRAADYDHSDVLHFEISPLNSASALCRGEFSRRRRDRSEIGRLTATYLVTDAGDNRRISALAVHSS